ncbi:hypothetical protein NP493_712g01003 [Ridgeia piscesae]|uniref:Phospholipid scramblase n=1 Tax=Ridgeia piscesae TaxID=27915 RepID=A0AAD9NMR3_RIDPI|nr:hypothetical protein NP493_712g01003 [Ridgeia piscesae]
MASPPPGYDHKGGPYTQQPQPQGYSSGDPQQGYYPQGQPQQGYYPPPQQQGFAPVQQVQPGMAMPMTQMSAGVPPGLEYLASLSSVKISQVLHIEEILLGWERNNVYQIMDQRNQQFLTAKEETDCCTRQFLGNIRPFTINISDMQGGMPVQLTRDLHCQGCCYPCCLQEMDICCPPSYKVATIKEKWSLCTPRYEIFDTTGRLMYTIEGICCYIKCCADVPFKVTRADGADAGEVVKHWAGCREMCGQVNEFTVSYAQNETALNKAILLGSAFLIDFMYFEVKNNN